MSKNSLYILLLAMISFVTWVACDKRRNKELPPATHSGENTIGCKVDGYTWVADDPWFDPGIDASYSYSNGHFSLSGVENDNRFKPRITISMEIYSAQHYTCHDSNIFYLEYELADWNCHGCEIENGWVEISRLDTFNRIISGRFEFLAQCNPNKFFSITDGRFDVKYDEN